VGAVVFAGAWNENEGLRNEALSNKCFDASPFCIREKLDRQRFAEAVGDKRDGAAEICCGAFLR
jgi:hypothetical protein